MAWRALSAGDAETAVSLYQALVEQAPGVADLRVNLALAHRRRGDLDGELAALNEALAIEPRRLTALLLKGANLEDRGQVNAASEAFKAALTVAPPPERVPPELRTLVRRAQAVIGRVQAAREAFYRDRLAEAYGAFSGEKLGRFAQSVDVLLGRKAIFRQHPHNFYFPGLSEAQFYERDAFPWLARIEQGTDVIRDEFEAVWRADHGFTPYIAHPKGAPLDQWAELNHSPRWSAYHLLKDGLEVAEHTAACPETAALLREAPGPALVRRSPNAMFSLLNPRTRIPPHTGDTNVRLVVHIPLIVPESTGFRVGNDVREWRVGEAFVFNDTIEHEAWNDSDQLRVVLIFDIWHPELSEPERSMIGELMAIGDAFRANSDPEPPALV